MKNEYLEQVVQQQNMVAEDLKLMRKRAAPMGAARAMALPAAPDRSGLPGGGGAPPPTGNETPAVDVRITGFWRWRRVIVPPNAYVVHTRLGQPEPLQCGLGVSFDFNPYTDSFLVVPAAMQTIMISANCICRERQGIVVQGYVQWIVDDFGTAYRKLDFSDPVEPMKVVNLQLKEQAEAAIKDTVASMSIDDVLADKQPIVQVLTTRLRQLAEGSKEREGLGLRVVTVQIKEAVVSSTRLWESLQRPFRAERQKEARLAELTHEGVVQEREAQASKSRAAREIESEREIAALRAQADAAAYDREEKERVRRLATQAETLAKTTEHEQARLEAQAALETLELERRLAREEQSRDAAHRQALRDLELAAARRKVDNDLSPELLQQRLLEVLPRVAESLPKPAELKSISLGGSASGGLTPLLEELLGVLRAVRRTRETPPA